MTEELEAAIAQSSIMDYLEVEIDLVEERREFLIDTLQLGIARGEICTMADYRDAKIAHFEDRADRLAVLKAPVIEFIQRTGGWVKNDYRNFPSLSANIRVGDIPALINHPAVEQVDIVSHGETPASGETDGSAIFFSHQFDTLIPGDGDSETDVDWGMRECTARR